MTATLILPQRERWWLSAYERQIIKLHSRTWILSEGPAFLPADFKKWREWAKETGKMYSPRKLWAPLTQYLSYIHCPVKKAVSGCLCSTWEISQSDKLAQLPSFALPQCHSYKETTLGFFPGLHFSQHAAGSCYFFLPTFPHNLSMETDAVWLVLDETSCIWKCSLSATSKHTLNWYDHSWPVFSPPTTGHYKHPGSHLSGNSVLRVTH